MQDLDVVFNCGIKKQFFKESSEQKKNRNMEKERKKYQRNKNNLVVYP